jgi:hypothetical protein
MRRDRPSVKEVTADPASVPVEIHAPRGLPDAKLDEIRTRLASLANDTDAAIDDPPLTLRRPGTRGAREPISLAESCVEMGALGHRFLHLVDAADGRGKLLYLCRDGGYGLVTPPADPG